MRTLNNASKDSYLPNRGPYKILKNTQRNISVIKNKIKKMYKKSEQCTKLHL